MDSGWAQVALAAVALGLMLLGLGWGAHRYLDSRISVVQDEMAARADADGELVADQLRQCDEERRETTREFIQTTRDYARSHQEFISALAAIEKQREANFTLLLSEIRRIER